MEPNIKHQGIILSKMEMSYVNDLPEGVLIKFLQNLSPENVQSFCTNERILKLCRNEPILKQLLIDAFTNTIIDKYSPLEPYLHSDLYKSKVGDRLKEVVYKIEKSKQKLEILPHQHDLYLAAEHAAHRLWRCLMGLKSEDFANLGFKSRRKQRDLLREILTWVHQYGDVST